MCKMYVDVSCDVQFNLQLVVLSIKTHPSTISVSQLHCVRFVTRMRRQLDGEILEEVEEACTHKSTRTHAGNVFVTRDLDL